MSDLLFEVRAIQKSLGCTFESAFARVMASTGRDGKTFGRDPVDKSTTLIAEARAGGLSGQHPAIRKELGKHKALEQSRATASVGDTVARLAKIREMMSKNPDLSFDSAFSAICLQEMSGTATPTSGNPAPGSFSLEKAQSIGKPAMMLVEGGKASFYVPLPGTLRDS